MEHNNNNNNNNNNSYLFVLMIVHSASFSLSYLREHFSHELNTVLIINMEPYKKRNNVVKSRQSGICIIITLQDNTNWNKL